MYDARTNQIISHRSTWRQTHNFLNENVNAGGEGARVVGCHASSGLQAQAEDVKNGGKGVVGGLREGTVSAAAAKVNLQQQESGGASKQHSPAGAQSH